MAKCTDSMLFPGGKEVTAVPEWVDTTGEAFYAALKSNPSAYSTAPANVEEAFDISFEPEEMMEMEDVNDIVKAVEEKQ